jgi:phasin family protein
MVRAAGQVGAHTFLHRGSARLDGGATDRRARAAIASLQGNPISRTITPEQLTAAQKANLETLFGLTNKAFEGVEKLVELNLQVAKTTLAEVAETTKAAMSVKDAQELLALQASLLQPAAEKAAAYSRHLYDIMAGTNAEVTKAAEAGMADSQKKVLALVDTAVKNAPAGTETPWRW